MYDVFNVFMVLEIIRKKKKEIFWNGYFEGYVKSGESSSFAKAAGLRMLNWELVFMELIDVFE